MRLLLKNSSMVFLDLPQVDSHNYFSGCFKSSLNVFLKEYERQMRVE